MPRLESTAPGDLVVATYNIHGGVGSDRRFDLMRIVQVIEEIDPDVVALQEVGDIRGRSPAGDHAAELAERLSRTVLYQPTMQKRGRAFGNAILTRLPVEGSRSYDLSISAREPRGCLRADLRFLDAQLHVFAVHLGLTHRERQAQTEMLLGADILRDAAVSWPLVVAGDFNLWFSGPIGRTIRNALVDASVEAGAADPTYPTRLPLFRLDRVYVDAAWAVQWAKVHASPLARQASDHLPLVVALRLRPSATGLPRGASGGTLHLNAGVGAAVVVGTGRPPGPASSGVGSRHSRTSPPGFPPTAAAGDGG